MKRAALDAAIDNARLASLLEHERQARQILRALIDRLYETVTRLDDPAGRLTQAGQQMEHHISLISASDLFDRQWYIAQYPDVVAANMDSARHYIFYGWLDERDPGPEFSGQFYLDTHQDVAAAGFNPLVHYLLFGKAEGRRILPAHRYQKKQYPNWDSQIAAVAGSEMFDRDWYLARYTDVAAADIDPAWHYLFHGWAEGRDPGPEFSTPFYLGSHPDVAEALTNPLIHYIHFGKAESRRIAPAALPAVVHDDMKASDDAPPPLPPPMAVEPALPPVEPVFFGLTPPPAIAWVRREHFTRGADYATVELAGLILGMVPARSGTSAAASARSIPAFCRMMGLDVREILRLPVGPDSRDMEDVARPAILFSEEGGRGTAVSDLWFASDWDIRIRFRSGPAGIIRCFQYDPDRNPPLVMVAETVLHGREHLDFVDAALINPYLPLLLTLTDPGGKLLSTSLLPFPSLVRGGPHHGELQAAGPNEDQVKNLRQISAVLLDKMMVPADFALARIDVDLSAAIGTEPIFSAEARSWLSAVMQIDLRPVNVPASLPARTRAHLEQTMQAPATSAGRPARSRKNASTLLTLPADALPCLHALVSHRLDVPSGKMQAVGSFIVGDAQSMEPKWLVQLPPMGATLLGLQPAAARTPYPVLTRLSADRDGPANEETRPLLAIRFCDMRLSKRDAWTLTPAAGSLADPPLRRTIGKRENISISVLLPFLQDMTPSMGVLLESLRRQTLAPYLQIVGVAGADRETSRRAHMVLEHLFPNRHLLLDGGEWTERNARLNLAAKHAKGKFLLVVGEDVMLHDPRTLEALYLMAADRKVATAGCQLIKRSKKKEKVSETVFHSGGIFLSPSGDAEWSFSEVDLRSAFACATFPVAANSSALFMVKETVWRKVGGLTEADGPADIDFCVRAMAKGLLHLCTTAVSASIGGGDFAEQGYHDRPLPGRLSDADQRSILSSTCLLRALRT